MTIKSRLMAKVDKNGPVVVPRLGKCWLWTAGTNGHGYGAMRAGKTHRYYGAHVISYRIFVLKGKRIPRGLEIDHLCRMRNCVRPSHLELVTKAENLRRGINHNRSKGACPRGHRYTKTNTRHYNGGRWCRACERDRSVRRRSERS